jgi:hypothetical protein
MICRVSVQEGLTFSVFVLVLAGIIFLLTYLAVTYFSTARSSEGPACGQCGYLCKGATSFTCTECGSDLREVGITRPAASRALVVAGRAALATAAATILIGAWVSF